MVLPTLVFQCSCCVPLRSVLLPQRRKCLIKDRLQALFVELPVRYIFIQATVDLEICYNALPHSGVVQRLPWRLIPDETDRLVVRQLLSFNVAVRQTFVIFEFHDSYEMCTHGVLIKGSAPRQRVE